LCSGNLRTEVLDEADALERMAPAWDRLAVECSRPFCAPAWLCAWWRHVAPDDAQLRFVVVNEGEDLIGVAPWFLTSERFGLRTLKGIGSPISRSVEPLAAPRRELEVARAIAAALAASPSAPDVLCFDGIDGGSRWPGDLARAWPGGPAAMLTRYELPTSSLSLHGEAGFASWFAGKSRNFRKDLRRDRRRFELRGGRIRLATTQTLEPDLEAFARLHRRRWEHRGGSMFLSDDVERMLADAARALVPLGRFRLWSLEIGNEIISSHLALTAGSEYSYWLTGFDERYAKLSPSILGTLVIVEDAFACGAQRIDFAGGIADWKSRFAAVDGTVAWRRVVPRGRRHALTRLGLAPGQWRRAAAKRLPAELRSGVVSLERRILR
jgi:CelD/BcsL family acetyltransferase involved in cellulose biosynthesis